MNGRSMKKSILAAAVAATAYGAAVAAPQQMASRELVERRISETTSNLVAKIDELRKELIVDLELNVETNKLSTEDEHFQRVFSALSNNMAVNMELITQAKGGGTNLVYLGDCVADATEDLYKGCFLADPGVVLKEGDWTTYCATNAYTGLCSYQKGRVDGAATNVVEYILTADGERYDRTKRDGDTKIVRTFVCTTNDARVIVCRYVKLSKKARNLILGLDK